MKIVMEPSAREKVETIVSTAISGTDESAHTSNVSHGFGVNEVGDGIKRIREDSHVESSSSFFTPDVYAQYFVRSWEYERKGRRKTAARMQEKPAELGMIISK